MPTSGKKGKNILSEIREIKPRRVVASVPNVFVLHQTVLCIGRGTCVLMSNEMYYSSDLFDKELFRTGPLSIIRSIPTLYTAIGICHASSVGVLVRMELADSQQN